MAIVQTKFVLPTVSRSDGTLAGLAAVQHAVARGAARRRLQGLGAPAANANAKMPGAVGSSGSLFVPMTNSTYIDPLTYTYSWPQQRIAAWQAAQKAAKKNAGLAALGYLADNSVTTQDLAVAGPPAPGAVPGTVVTPSGKTVDEGTFWNTVFSPSNPYVQQAAAQSAVQNGQSTPPAGQQNSATAISPTAMWALGGVGLLAVVAIAVKARGPKTGKPIAGMHVYE